MGEVSALVQVHPHQRVAGLQDRKLNGEIRRGTGVGLHICIGASEQLLGPLDRNGLNDVDHLTAAIVALSGIPFRVLVREGASHSCHDCLADPVLGRDQLNMIILALNLLFDRRCDLRIHFPDFLN